jgi:two-component system sensor histidine kinase PilS (NtrC family)
VQAGTLGLLCFISALFIQALGRRLEQSESMAQRHAATVAELQVLNGLILERMRTGILAIDADSRILMANPASRTLLGQPPMSNEPLCQRFAELAEIMEEWQKNPALTPRTLRGFSEGPVLQPSFAPLLRRNEQSLLIFLEDVSQITQQAQQIKLASLGRLTASIAHEIRNPLGAISHAAQLLQEAEDLSPADQRLTQIILDHSRRMNLIVENILQLSRRRQAEPELLNLCCWLREFCRNQQSGLPESGTLELVCEDESLQTAFDPEQLTQVLINLIQNGMRYSERRHGQARIRLRLFLEAERQQPALDVLDDGEGISPAVADNLFEPFFTTESKGTGLGLYISRELCQANRARLDHIPDQQDGACFRLTFAHPQTAS